MNRNKTFGNAKRYKDSGTGTLGRIGSLFFLSSVLITGVDAANNPVEGDAGFEPTVVAQAVSNGLFSDDINGLQLAQVSTQTTTYSSSQTAISDTEQSLLESRTKELMVLDNRDVDEVSVRLKEIIKGRYEADHLYIQTLTQVDELRQQLSAYEDLLNDAKQRQEMLGAEKLTLQNDLDRILFERDGAKNQIHTLTNEIRSEKRMAIDELTAQLAQMTADREQAQARADSVAELLAQKDNMLSTMKAQFDDLVAQNELARGEAADINGVLSDKENALTKVNAELQRFKAERDGALEDIAGLSHAVSEKDDALIALRAEVNDLVAQRNKAMQEASSLAGALSLSKSKGVEVSGALLSEQQKHSSSVASIAALEADLNALQEKYTSVNGERNALLASKAQLQSSSAELTYKVAALQDEIVALNGALTDLQKQADANLASVNTSFAKQRSSLESELSDKDQLVVARDRQLAGLQAEMLSLQNAIANTQQQAVVQLAAANTGIEEQRLRLQSELAEKAKSVLEMDERMAKLKAEMEKRRAEWESQVAEQDTQILAMKSNLAALKTDRDQISSLKSKSDLKVGSMQKQLDGLSAELSASDKKLKKVTADAASRLAKLKAQIVGLETTGVSAEEQLKKLSGLNQGLDGQLSSMRVKLASVNDENAKNVKKLQEQLNVINAASSKKQSMEAELEQLKLSVADYESSLKASRQKLLDMELNQQAEIAAKKSELEKAESLSEALARQMENAKLENIEVLAARADNAIPLVLGNADFFAQGSAELTKQGTINLARLASIVGKYSDRRIVVEGHTDSVPISNRLKARFASNWELSVARAATAVRHLQIESKIDPLNLSAAGFGEYKPVASNDTREGRQKNRRVEVLLYPVNREFTNVSSIDE